ncbi:tigger transposable element-derived protein 1-like [Crotalus tigris]|uniref:tigger transposable element-derived protein 1-like n=1 Tax=Crotalus tigris TaxID=88082 RepID=UPI00192F6240|nr:tigger transposable element-derived protein 1-like [Crotalus tigris]
MEEQRLVVPKEEEEGTENGGRDPLIVQVRTLGDFLTQHGTSHLKPESKDEMHQCWDSQWQEFLKSVAGLPIAPSPLEENAADSQASLGRDKEHPQEESSGEAREKSVLQRDPSMDQRAWMGREKLDSSIKVKVEEIQEEVNLESQALLSLRQFSSQDAEEHQEMSSNRKNPGSTEASSKRHRKVIDLNLKMKIIKAYEAGKKINKIAKEEGLAHSTISATVKDRERIKETLKGAAGMNTSITRQRKGLIHKMEPLLMLWIKDRIQKRLPMSLPFIQTKARSIFTTLKERADEECAETFTASHGWFMRFQQRFPYQILPSGEASWADKEAAKRFLDELDDVVAEGNYFAEQIFRVDETVLYWKRILGQTYIHKEAQAMPGCKAFKDRVTLVLGGNVAGFKLKPFVIFKSDHAGIVQNINKDTLPVYYRFDSETWMTYILFEDWFTNCFIPQVKEYCGQKGIPFKILLLLDKAPGYPLHLDSLHSDVKVVCLPPSITTLLQPMCQRALLVFKACYLHAVFAKALAAMEDDKVTLPKFWESYNILHCIENIVAAWEDFSVKSMQGFWEKCLNRYTAFANNFEGFNHKQNLDEINKKILTLTKSLGLEFEAEDVKNLIAYTEGELPNEDLIELKKELEAQKVKEEVAEKERRKEEKVVEVELKTFNEKGIKPTDNPQPSTSYASRSDVPENSENHESFKGHMSNLMFTDKMSAKRKSYSVEFKKAIVEDSRGKNLTAFCKEKVLDVRMVRKWRAEYKNLSQQVDKGNAKKRKCGSGRQPLFPELEGNICEWIADRRAKALVVRRADIQAFALAMAPQLEISPEFKASQHWLDDFLHRYKLSLKKINNIVEAEH